MKTTPVPFRIRPAALTLALLAVCASHKLWALGEEDFGNAPLSAANYTDWPGILPVVNHPARVYHVWVNGNEFFYYRGDATALNDVLQKFAASTAAVHEVLLRPGPGVASTFARNKTIPYDWELHLVGGIARYQTTLDLGSNVWNTTPRLTVCVGKDLDLARLKIPAGIALLELADVGRRCRAALASSDKSVRGWGAGELARLDPYDRENLAAIAKLLHDPDDWVRLNAVGALALFGAKAAAELPALRQLLDAGDPNLKASLERSIAAIQQARDDLAAEAEHHRLLEKIRDFCAARKRATGSPH